MKKILSLLTLITAIGAYADLSINPVAQPPSTLAPERAIIPITRFQLTGENCTIHKIVLQKNGTTPDNNFGEVLLILEEDNSIRARDMLTADGKFVFSGPFFFTGEKTVTFTVSLRLWSNLEPYAGRKISISVAEIEGECTMNGTLPITGATLTFNHSLQITHMLVTPLATTGEERLINVPNQVLGSFKTHVWNSGPATITNMWLWTSSEYVKNITLVNGDQVVAGPVDAQWAGEDGSGQIHFTDAITVPPGDSTFTILGRLEPEGFNNNSWLNISTTPSSDWSMVDMMTGYQFEPWPSGVVNLGTFEIAGPILVMSGDAWGTTVAPGSRNSEIWQVNVNAAEYRSGEDVLLERVRLVFDSPLAATYLSDMRIVSTNGTVLAGPETIVTTPTNCFADMIFIHPLLVPKDDWRGVNLSVRADVVDADVTRTVLHINLEKDYPWPNTIAHGVLSGARSEIVILRQPGIPIWIDQLSDASMTVVSTNTTVSQDIAVNVPNQTLGEFMMTVTGEPVSIGWLPFSITTTGTGLLTGVTLVDENGVVVAGPVDTIVWGNQVQRIPFRDTVLFPMGTHLYTLKGKLPTTFANGSTLSASVIPSEDWHYTVGLTSSKTLNLKGVGLLAMSTRLVRGPSLHIAIGAPYSHNVVAGSAGVIGGVFDLDASESSEDIRLTSIPIFYHRSGGLATDVTRCKLYANDNLLTSGVNEVNPLTVGEVNFTFDSPITVTKGTRTRIVLRCTVRESTVGSFSWSIEDASVRYQGAVGVTSARVVDEVFVLSLPTEGAKRFIIPGAKIDGFSFFTREDRNILNLSGWIKPGTAYIVEASADLKTWKPVGEVSPNDSEVLKEPAVGILNAEFKDRAFLRLVERQQ